MSELISLVNKAEKFCIESHEGVYRRNSGKPYRVHPFAMREKAHQMGYKDPFLDIVLLLHDVTEKDNIAKNTVVSFEKIEQTFGVQVMSALHALDRTDKSMYQYWSEIFNYKHVVVPLAKSFDINDNSSDHQFISWYFVQQTKTFGLPLQKKTDIRLYNETSHLINLAETRILGDMDLKDAWKFDFQKQADKYAFLKKK